MKTISFMLLLTMISSCASEKPKFVKEDVCSNESLKYLRNPRNKIKRTLNDPAIIQEISKTTNLMQSCYESFKQRTEFEEFNTCLVVGVNEVSQIEFYNFSSKQIKLDREFMQCAESVIKTIPFEKYGSNYILIQSYQFYVGLQKKAP